jgi:hypothetical protein
MFLENLAEKSQCPRAFLTQKSAPWPWWRRWKRAGCEGERGAHKKIYIEAEQGSAEQQTRKGEGEDERTGWMEATGR